MSQTKRSPGLAGTGGAVRVGSGLLLSAARRLVETAPGGDFGSGERFLAAASMHGIDLTHFYATLDEGGGADQVCLAVESSGRTANLYASTPRSANERASLVRAIEGACGSLKKTRVAQALLRPDEGELSAALEAAGFERVAELAFMRGTLQGALRASRSVRQLAWAEGVEVRRASEVGSVDVVAALEASYIDTLDCPALCRLRATEDVLASHREVGVYEPERWLIVYAGGVASGAALLSRCPGEGMVEIVYLGIGPALRGRGVGARLLSEALRGFGDEAGSELTCAVDLANGPALRLYRGFGMRETDRRLAYVRAVARESHVE